VLGERARGVERYAPRAIEIVRQWVNFERRDGRIGQYRQHVPQLGQSLRGHRAIARDRWNLNVAAT
jgi:hypothetical protein